jgi:hypothetical protein
MDFSKNDFSQAKVGDKVWSCEYGGGVIKQIFYNRDYPLKVYFEQTGMEESYTLKGRQALINLYPTLFWSEIHFDIPERPKRKVERRIERWAAYDSADGELTFSNSEEQATHAVERWNNDTQQDRWQAVKTIITYEIEE